MQRLLVLKRNTSEITTTAWSTTLSTKKSRCWAIPVEGFFANGTSLLVTMDIDTSLSVKILRFEKPKGCKRGKGSLSSKKRKIPICTKGNKGRDDRIYVNSINVKCGSLGFYLLGFSSEVSVKYFKMAPWCRVKAQTKWIDVTSCKFLLLMQSGVVGRNDCSWSVGPHSRRNRA